MNVACLFEQSGTFKNVLIGKGHSAVDYDILNQYGETNFQIDLFKEIENGTIDFINNYDLVFAFYPCTWFSVNNSFIYNRTLPQFKNWSKEKIDNYIDKRLEQYHRAKTNLLKLIEHCNVPLIIENPRSKTIENILGMPQCYVSNRAKYGDILVKPTYFYCYNGVYISKLDEKPKTLGKDINHLPKGKRSLIHKDFAENIINNICFRGD